jgi:hypothetical protein
MKTRNYNQPGQRTSAQIQYQLKRAEAGFKNLDKSNDPDTRKEFLEKRIQDLKIELQQKSKL